MPAKVLDKIYGVVYNIGNHKGYDFQSFHTEKRNPRKLQLSGISFGIMSDLLSVCFWLCGNFINILIFVIQ